MKTNQDLETIEAMKKYGGSFVAALAECFALADSQNFTILKQSFSTYCRQYE